MLYNAGRKDELTLQTEERIIAGCSISQKLCFVGANTELMKKFCSPNKVNIIAELNNCDDTIGNIREIKKFLDNNEYERVYIITHDYHQRRVEHLLDYFKLNRNEVAVIPAESMLGIKNRKDFVEFFKLVYTLFLIKLKLIK